MDYLTGKPNHIEDYLVTVRTGQWFSWSDPTNKIYANLVVLDGGAKTYRIRLYKWIKNIAR